MESIIQQHVFNHNLSAPDSVKFEELITQKSMVSQAAPGEPVGILAAQVNLVFPKKSDPY
jgi:hypothetical protein